jgi:poly(3-hydroxybutyrate) depolymerase
MEIKICAGEPNDTNRDYVPEAIKGSNMVVNENGNNSIVYPERLKEYSGILVDDLEDRWYEYVPSSYDGSRNVPLVISNHGGLMTGWAQAIYSSWTLLSEKEGFICVFPDAHAMHFWTMQEPIGKPEPEMKLLLPIPKAEKDYKKNHDMNYMLALIQLMKEKYSIDSGRIFMQGMSAGHGMTDQFARYYGNVLAGAAGAGGASRKNSLYTEDGKIYNLGGPVPMWVSHPEKNGTEEEYEREIEGQKDTREYWLKINECDPIPQIQIIGEHNFAFYSGKKADYVYLDIKNRDHGQALDEAFLYWNYLFSGVHRELDGTLIQGKSKMERTGDQLGLAFVAGSTRVWFENQITDISTPPEKWLKLKYHGLNGGQKIRGEYLCVPVSFLAKAFHAEYFPSTDTLTAELILADGRKVQFARGIIGCMVDNNLCSMYCEALHRNGELLISVEWFCKSLLGLQVSACDGVVYVTDHYAELSKFMAVLIRDLLEKP